MPTARPRRLAALAALASATLACASGSSGGAGPPQVSYGEPVELWRNGGCFTSWCQTGW
jgi:hypothetical protein